MISFFSCFLRNSLLSSRPVPPESLANPSFSRFLPSHPALSRVSQLSCLFTLFLNADIVAKVLGVSSSTSYELMHEPDFPVLNVGSRMVVPKEAFIQWVTKHTEGGVRE